MAEEKIRFLPYKQAAELVAAIQEEEDIDNPDRHILTVYNHEDRAICWFDFDEVMRDAGITGMSEALRQTVMDYVLHRIPDWVQGK